MTDTTSWEQQQSFINDQTTPKLFVGSRQTGKTYALLEIAKETGATFVGPSRPMTRVVTGMDNYSQNIDLHSPTNRRQIRRDTVVIDEIFMMADTRRGDLRSIITNNTVIAAAGTPRTPPIHPLIRKTFRSIHMSGVCESGLTDSLQDLVRKAPSEIFVHRTMGGYDVLVLISGHQKTAIASDGTNIYTSTKNDVCLAAAESIAHLKQER